jgi:hypothetical protein
MGAGRPVLARELLGAVETSRSHGGELSARHGFQGFGEALGDPSRSKNTPANLLAHVDNPPLSQEKEEKENTPTR